MQVTAEIRWFWRDDEPRDVLDWFVSADVHGEPTATPPSRVDRYLVDGQQAELGIKARGGRHGVEIKGLVDAHAASLDIAPFVGPVEIWSKWWTSAMSLDAGSTIAIAKTRQVRAFETTGASPLEATKHLAAWLSGAVPLPSRGCNVEITRVETPDGQLAWTMALEAYGDLSTVSADLVATAEAMADRRPPGFRNAECLSYPAWLEAM